MGSGTFLAAGDFLRIIILNMIFMQMMSNESYSQYQVIKNYNKFKLTLIYIHPIINIGVLTQQIIFFIRKNAQNQQIKTFIPYFNIGQSLVFIIMVLIIASVMDKFNKINVTRFLNFFNMVFQIAYIFIYYEYSVYSQKAQQNFWIFYWMMLINLGFFYAYEGLKLKIFIVLVSNILLMILSYNSDIGQENFAWFTFIIILELICIIISQYQEYRLNQTTDSFKEILKHQNISYIIYDQKNVLVLTQKYTKQLLSNLMVQEQRVMDKLSNCKLISKQNTEIDWLVAVKSFSRKQKISEYKLLIQDIVYHVKFMPFIYQRKYSFMITIDNVSQINKKSALQGQIYKNKKILDSIPQELLNITKKSLQVIYNFNRHGVYAQQLKMIRSIQKLLQIQKVILQDIEGFSKDQQEEQVICEKINVKKLSEQISQIFNLLQQDKNIKICWKIDKAVKLYSDYSKLKRVLINILSNSFRFSENQNSQINIYLKANKQFTLFSLHIEGEGMSEDTINRLKDHMKGQCRNRLLTQAFGISMGMYVSNKLARVLGNDRKFIHIENKSFGTLIQFMVKNIGIKNGVRQKNADLIQSIDEFIEYK